MNEETAAAILKALAEIWISQKETKNETRKAD